MQQLAGPATPTPIRLLTASLRLTSRSSIRRQQECRPPCGSLHQPTPWLSYQEVLAPAAYRRLAGWGSNRTVTNAWTTLTLNWQPTFVNWALDGKIVKTVKNGDRTSLGTIQSPNNAARVFFSIGSEGGGRFDAAGRPAVSAFNNFRRIICDLPEPKTLAQLGPPWLTAVLYPAP
ncbi:hypothetical protein OEZ86_006277 [Tetradesmus obliquus]|nr:hypothetical protein OEZ86_006277 [Tetradesmus obliquus]